jgi:dTDP-4-dehydrorhamnose reductase
VVGANGQVGYEVVRELATLGRVVALTRAECDLADPPAAAAAVRAARPAVVVNAAAYTAVDRAEQDEAACRAANADAPALMAAAAVGVPFVHYSTDYVFDGTKDAPYQEDDAPNPLGVYGRTKLDGERGVAAANPAHLVFRTSWVYAARGQNFVRTMLRLARERDELRVVADQVGAPTWARSLAAATAQVVGAALRAPEGPAAWVAARSGVYHLTAAGSTSWHGFAEAILTADPARAEQRARRVVPIATTDFPTPARRPANSRLDCSRAEARLGLSIPDWRDQLALALAP